MEAEPAAAASPGARSATHYQAAAQCFTHARCTPVDIIRVMRCCKLTPRRPRDAFERRPVKAVHWPGPPIV
jgi:hypothetical protein